MERIKLQNAGQWPNPFGKDYQALSWRLRYAHDSIEEADLYCAAEVMEAYSALICHPELLTLKDVERIISGVRKEAERS